MRLLTLLPLVAHFISVIQASRGHQHFHSHPRHGWKGWDSSPTSESGNNGAPFETTITLGGYQTVCTLESKPTEVILSGYTTTLPAAPSTTYTTRVTIGGQPTVFTLGPKPSPVTIGGTTTTISASPFPAPAAPTSVTTIIYEGQTTVCTYGSLPTTVTIGTFTTTLSIGSGNGHSTGRYSPGATTSASGSAGSYSGTGTLSLPPSLSSQIFHPTVIPPATLGTSNIPSGNGALSQQSQNGNSDLGSLSAPKLPPFIGANSNGSSYAGTAPWGNVGTSSVNPSSVPSTGVTRTYDFTVARATLAPDGVERSMVVVNGAFPGPMIEANWGDTIQVTVTNAITGPEEGTSIHWHGLLQKNSQYMDGVPGIQQCPIAPGGTFTYTFVADLYGTSWYHAHYSAQYAGGAFGPMIIYGPDNANYDVDLGPVILTDYYHKDYFTIVEEVMGTDLTKIAPQSINNLINGKGDYNCSLITDNTTCTSNAGYSKFSFTNGQTYRLRLMNAGAEGIQKFSIDSHYLTVIAYDFVPIVPYTTTVVTLGVGQRADVLVSANLTSTSAVWMRSTISSCSLATQPDGYGMIYYQNANTSAIPTSTAWTDNTKPCANDDLSTIVPYYPISPPSASTTLDITVNFEINSTGNFVWTMNNSTFRVDYNDPILMLASQGNDSYPYDPEWNVYDLGANTSQIVVVYNPTPVAHPMHLHGHNMYVLAEGTTTDSDWDGTVVNAANPTRRDVQMLQPYGFMAMQFDSDNPGVWPFHCHIAWHVSGGLYVNLLESPSKVTSIDYPSAFTQQCQAWSSYTSEGPIDQIDSGL